MSLPWSDISSLGDPAGMRLLAARLRILAERIPQAARDVDRRFDRLNFLGPARDRLDARMDARVGDSRRIAGQLTDAAEALTRSAAEVEARIAELRAIHLRASEEEGP